MSKIPQHKTLSPRTFMNLQHDSQCGVRQRWLDLTNWAYPNCCSWTRYRKSWKCEQHEALLHQKKSQWFDTQLRITTPRLNVEKKKGLWPPTVLHNHVCIFLVRSAQNLLWMAIFSQEFAFLLIRGENGHPLHAFRGFWRQPSVALHGSDNVLGHTLAHAIMDTQGS